MESCASSQKTTTVASMARTFRFGALIALTLFGCGGASEPPRAPNACVPNDHGQPLTLTDATATGPYAVGTLDVTIVDSSRATPAHGTYAGAADRTLVVTLWYPATTAGSEVTAASGGPFPIVAHSHGFSSNRSENVLLASHLASHGYIVAAPSFPVSNIAAPGGPSTVDMPEQPGDISFVIDHVIGLGTTAGHPLFGAVDSLRIAATGLSLGGGTTLLTTFHPTLRDPRIDVAVAFAPVAALFGPDFYATTNTPLLVLFGNADAILDYTVHAAAVRANAQAPRSLLTLDRGTHTGFTNISLVFEGEPGYEHIDALGCNGLMMTGGSGTQPDLYTLLGGAAAGLVIPTVEGAFCVTPLGIGMAPSRQLEITNAATLTFLDAYLATDSVARERACAYSERGLPLEADVTLDRR